MFGGIHMIQGLLQCSSNRRHEEANNIVMHSISLGRQAIYDPTCQAEHMAFYMQYGRTPEEVIQHVSD